MRTFLIAMGGIRVGTIRPLELGTDGLLEVVDTPDLPGGFGYYAIPCLPRPNITPKKKPKSVSVAVRGCTLKTSCAQPKVKFSMSFDVIGCSEENELETYLMAQAAMGLLDDDEPDSKDFRIRSLEKDLHQLQSQNARLRDQLSREKRRKK
jgi:hypothetical protein